MSTLHPSYHSYGSGLCRHGEERKFIVGDDPQARFGSLKDVEVLHVGRGMLRTFIRNLHLVPKFYRSNGQTLLR